MKALVLVASGLHLGTIGCYGNEWIQTPNLDRLAAEGIVLDQHYADQPDAAGAERAWQTACYRLPSASSAEDAALPEPTPLFPLLAESGIGTFLISAGEMQDDAPVAAGWQRFRRAEFTANEAAIGEKLAAVLAQALDHLASYRKWLLRADLRILRPPWNAPREFRELYAMSDPEEDEGEPPFVSANVEATQEHAVRELQARYAAAVTYLDAAVGQILHELEQRGLLNDMLVLVTTDHGQPLGEDEARRGSCRLLHEERIHIPLIFRLPGKAEAGRRVPAFTQSIDLLPTLCDVYGLPLPAVHGKSLLPLVRGQRSPIRAYACAGFRTGDTVEWALRSSHWGFLEPVLAAASDSSAEPELYVKPDDRWEVNNVRHHHQELTERLKQTLRRFVEATRRPGPLRPPPLPDLDAERAEQPPEHATDSVEGEMPP